MKKQQIAEKIYTEAKANYQTALDKLEKLMEVYELAERHHLEERYLLQEPIYELEVEVDELSDKLNAARKAVDLEQDGIHIQFNKDGSLSGRIFIAGF